MNYEDGLEFQSIRREQDHIHRLVRTLDDRLDALAESFRAPNRSSSEPRPHKSPINPPTPASPMAAVHPHPKESRAADLLSAPMASAKSPTPKISAEPANPDSPEPPVDAPPPPAPARPDRTAFEFELGRVWLVRVGIVVLLTGLVFLGNLAYQHIVPRLGPGMKLGLIVAAGGTLAGIGGWMEKRRESMRNYARVLLAGGIAAIYYSCYAAHFVLALRVIESAVLGGALLLAFAGGIAWFAHRRRSETIASLAILLSYYTSCINPVGTFTLFSNALLTAAAVFFLVKNRWTRITYLSVAATYASYAYWRFFAGDIAAGTDSAWMQVSFLACYWLLFTVAAFLTDRRAMNAVRRTSFVTANNAAFFALAAHAIAADGSGKFWIFSLAYGAILLGLSKFAAWRDADDRALDAAYLAQGLALTTTGLATHVTGQQLALTFAAQGTVLLSCARARQARLLALGGMLSLAASFALAGLGLVLMPDHAAATAGVAALALLFNAWWFKRQRGLTADRMQPVASSVTIGALILGVGWLEKIAPAHAASWLAAVALAIAFVPLAEFAILGQALLPIAVAKWIVFTLPLGVAARFDGTVLLACGIALAHRWPRARSIDPILRTVAEGVAALCSVAVAIFWVRQELTPVQAMAAASVLGLAWIAAARFTGARLLSLAGIAISFTAVADFTQLQEGSHWAIALLPIAHVALLPAIFRREECSHLCAVLASVMLLAWSWVHIPREWLALFYAATAAVLALVGARRRELILTGLALVLGTLATLLFWSRIDVSGEWRNVAAVLVFAAACRLSRKIWPAEPMLSAAPIVAWSTIAGLTARITFVHTLPSLTVAWSLLAFAFFAAGLALRERHYRLGGLALLGLSVGRVFFVDVWVFEPVWRIVSFIVLGLVLLIIGYAYNRFEEKLRRWF